MKPPEAVPKNSCMALDVHFFEGLTRFPSPPPVPGEMAVWIITVLNC